MKFKLAQLTADQGSCGRSRQRPSDWTKPAAMAIPKEGYFKLEQGRYGPVFPKTPANYGFTIIAKVKPGRSKRSATMERRLRTAVAESSVSFLHLSSCITYDGFCLMSAARLYFMYQGYFDTDFDKYTEDAVAIFGSSGLTTVFENLEGFPDGLEDKCSSVRKVLAGPPLAQLSGIRGISVCQRRRSQEGSQGQERTIRHARPDAVTPWCIDQKVR